MRPVRKGSSPVQGDFGNYRDAFDYLLIRIGTGHFGNIGISQYCSYCERPISTNLAVEHIEPKNGEFSKPLLKNRWSNFLLSCVNCNSKKSSKKVDFTQLYFPDRDNTFHALEYCFNGIIQANPKLTKTQKEIAINTIALFGLNDEIDSDVQGVAKDRRTQRVNVWLLALDSFEDFNKDPNNPAIQKSIVKDMLANGFFSIWMKVFSAYSEMTNRFIDAMKGTRESGCFDPAANIITPHPNEDNLMGGGKI